MKKPSRVSLALAAAATLLGGGAALTAGPAAAAPAAPGGAAVASKAAVKGTAPSCVRRDVIKHEKKVTVGNDCGRTMHLKVVIDHGPDSRCLTYQHGQAWSWHWRLGSYGKVVTC
ncbi:hypothetical protein GCM10009801_14670 [Streptomyces albiaxialis]|uniref:Uncharacterized protein n=1 Tax=Streptomyces albiaxialis TaxID=329523 RepID=A0ABN2VPN1_9ACTN